MTLVKIKSFEAELEETKYWPYLMIECSRIKFKLADGQDFYSFLPTSMLDFT